MRYRRTPSGYYGPAGSPRRSRPPKPMSNPGTPGLEAAIRTFERFHDRPAGEGVYPFTGQADGIFKQTWKVPDADETGLVGVAVRTLYESDKWHPKGQTTQYYHDHDKGVRFYAPFEAVPDAEPEHFPYEFPGNMMLIGECIGFVVAPTWLGKPVDNHMKGRNILVSSPDGYVDPKWPERCFLAIVNLDKNVVEGLIDGPKLRITAHGIEG
jgi:hypothetical protein